MPQELKEKEYAGASVYQATNEALKDGAEVRVYCPFCDWFTTSRIPIQNMRKKEGRPPLSWFERKRILQLKKEGHSYRVISHRLEVSLPTVQKYCSRKAQIIEAKKALRDSLFEHINECHLE